MSVIAIYSKILIIFITKLIETKHWWIKYCFIVYKIIQLKNILRKTNRSTLPISFGIFQEQWYIGF